MGFLLQYIGTETGAVATVKGRATASAFFLQCIYKRPNGLSRFFIDNTGYRSLFASIGHNGAVSVVWIVDFFEPEDGHAKAEFL
jgi:hypothetical protein